MLDSKAISKCPFVRFANNRMPRVIGRTIRDRVSILDIVLLNLLFSFWILLSSSRISPSLVFRLNKNPNEIEKVIVKTITIHVIKVGNHGMIPKIAKIKTVNKIMEVMNSKWVLSMPSLFTRTLAVIFTLLLLVINTMIYSRDSRTNINLIYIVYSSNTRLKTWRFDRCSTG